MSQRPFGDERDLQLRLEQIVAQQLHGRALVLALLHLVVIVVVLAHGIGAGVVRSEDTRDDRAAPHHCHHTISQRRRHRQHRSHRQHRTPTTQDGPSSLSLSSAPTPRCRCSPSGPLRLGLEFSTNNAG